MVDKQTDTARAIIGGEQAMVYRNTPETRRTPVPGCRELDDVRGRLMRSVLVIVALALLAGGCAARVRHVIRTDGTADWGRLSCSSCEWIDGAYDCLCTGLFRVAPHPDVFLMLAPCSLEKPDLVGCWTDKITFLRDRLVYEASGHEVECTGVRRGSWHTRYAKACIYTDPYDDATKLSKCKVYPTVKSGVRFDCEGYSGLGFDSSGRSQGISLPKPNPKRRHVERASVKRSAPTDRSWSCIDCEEVSDGLWCARCSGHDNRIAAKDCLVRDGVTLGAPDVELVSICKETMVVERKRGASGR